jgi:DNA-binding Xre family transcriptional regulator
VNGLLTRYDREILEKLMNYFDCDISDILVVEHDPR